MQIAAMLLWLGLFYGVAKVVNQVTKRPAMNPWTWFAASYGVLYAIGLVIGLVRNTPNFSYIAGYYLPAVLVALALGLWRAPKWRAANQTHQPTVAERGQRADLRD